MHSTTVAIDLAKNVFELGAADAQWKVVERVRLNRARFSAFFVHRDPCRVVMEACGSAHYWARRIAACGHEVQLVPAQYVRPYVRRNKTDRADAAALLEVVRCGEIRPVPIKTVEQQQILGLHRLRSQWQCTRQRYLNALRGLLREYGIPIPLGVTLAKSKIAQHLEQPQSEVPAAILPVLKQMLRDIAGAEENINQVERTLAALSRSDERVQQMLRIPGIGLLTSTALRAIVGDIQRFPSGRHFASWLGLTACEYSSGEHRCLRGISKRGDVYARTLLIVDTIKRLSHWPIAWRASFGRHGNTNGPSMVTGPAVRLIKQVNPST